MLNLNLRGMLLLLSCTALLSACLPEDKDPNVMAEATGAGKETGGYYGAALGNVAMQIQNAVVSDASWFENITTGQSLDLASMGIDLQSLPADIKSHICPTGAGSEVMQITWLDGRNEDGKFTLKGIGEDGSTLMSALRSRVSAEQLGTYTGQNSLALSNNETTVIPSSCANMDIPAGAPVIAFRIARPAAPATTLSRTEYQSVECGLNDQDAEQNGALVQKRIVTYNADGTIDFGTWSDDDMGGCIAAVNVVANLDDAQKTAASKLENFADIGLRAVLEAQIAAMDCKTFTVNETNNANTQKEIDTCGHGDTVKGKGEIEETAGAIDTDTKTLSCNAAPVATTLPAPTGMNGTVSAVLSWSGTAVLERQRTATTVTAAGTTGTSDSHTQVAKWIGQVGGVHCIATDSFTANCQQINGAPALHTGPEILTRSVPVPAVSIGGQVTENLSGGRVHYIEPWQWLGFTVHCGGGYDFDGAKCIVANPIQETLVNVDFLNRSVATNAGGVSGIRESTADWDGEEGRKIFKPKMNPNGVVDLTSIQCSWDEYKNELPDCPTLMANETRQGNYAPAEMTLADPTPKAMSGPGIAYSVIQGPHSLSGDGGGSWSKSMSNQGGVINHIRNSVAAEYTKLMAEGYFVKELSRSYYHHFDCWSGYVSGCGGSYTVSSRMYIGPGADTKYLKAWRYSPSHQITLLNTQGINKNKSEAWESAPGVVAIKQNPVDPVRCGEGWSSSFTRPATYYVYWQDCSGKGGCTSGYNTYNTTVTVYTNNVREWRSDLGFSNSVTRYTWSNPGGSGTVYNLNQVPASFSWYQ